MIVDASALLAVVLDEPDGRRFAEAIASAPRARMPAAAWFEAALAVDIRGDDLASRRFDDAVRSLQIELIAFTPQHAAFAREARRQYGRRQHPAQLNFCDCMVYGVAKAEREPLLFKGNDFAQTDVEPALKD
ncbi:MAG: type II toxin-antitoxin system VapC family toxin [Acetobacteraceae bacterium]